MGLSVVILAAGQGTRMNATIPKVLHPLGGRALVSHVLATARALDPDHIHVVYGHGGERVFEAIDESGVQRVLQAEQRGTGHALQQALPGIDDEDTVLVLFADVPLISSHTLQALIQGLDEAPLALLTVILRDPQGYGRILRDDTGQVVKIVEDRDADAIERKVNEVNTGILAASAGDFKRWLSGVGTDNAQGEYYLTDCIALSVAEGGRIKAVVCHDPHEVAGVNDKVQLAELERVFQRRQAQALMREGVSLADPARFDLRGALSVGRDVWIDVNVVLEGEVQFGDGVRIGANCVILDSQIESGVEILPHSHIQGAHIGRDCSIGPYARIRPETVLHEGAKVGNFVEIKKSVVMEHSKINHLSYIGDSEVGRRVNVGAGTITCNYDGANKHKTVIGDDAFIGSNTELVAPVSVGAGATIGAGSTITKDTPEAELTLSRSKQMTLKGWQRPRKKKD